LNEVGNGAVEIASVDRREKAAEHASADTLPIKDEPDLRFLGASLGELMVASMLSRVGPSP